MIEPSFIRNWWPGNSWESDQSEESVKWKSGITCLSNYIMLGWHHLQTSLEFYFFKWHITYQVLKAVPIFLSSNTKQWHLLQTSAPKREATLKIAKKMKQISSHPITRYVCAQYHSPISFICSLIFLESSRSMAFRTKLCSRAFWQPPKY